MDQEHGFYIGKCLGYQQTKNFFFSHSFECEIGNLWPPRPEIVLIWPFAENVCRSWKRRLGQAGRQEGTQTDGSSEGKSPQFS